MCNDLFLQAAAHIHRYLNLDEQVLRDLAEDSKEGESSTIIAAFYCWNFLRVHINYEISSNSVISPKGDDRGSLNFCQVCLAV